MQKITYEKEEISTDYVTGEVKQKNTTQISKMPVEPPFVKLYIDDVIKLKDLPKGNSKLLYQLVRLLNYEGQVILNGSIKNIIAERLGIKKQSIDNILNNLVKKDIIKRYATGIYLLNPSLFAKGEWSDIRKLRNKYIELNIKYMETGEKEIIGKIKDSKEKKI